MAEGRTRTVRVQITNHGLEGRFALRPSHHVIAGDEHELLLLLQEKAVELFGDGEAAFDLVYDGVPTDDTAWVVLHANDRIDAVSVSDGELFVDKVCSQCNAQLGERTTVSRMVNVRGVKEHIAFVASAHSLFMPTAIDDAVVDLLSDGERSVLGLLELRATGRSRRRFWETAARAPVTRVPKKGRAPSGWKCGSCGALAWMYVPPAPTDYVRRDSLLKAPHSIAVLGQNSSSGRLIVRQSRWNELRKHGVKCVSSKLGVLDDDEIETKLEDMLPPLARPTIT